MLHIMVKIQQAIQASQIPRLPVPLTPSGAYTCHFTAHVHVHMCARVSVYMQCRAAPAL